MLTVIAVLWTHIRVNVAQMREDPEAGYSTETVVVTALLVALALAAIGDVIYNKVTGKAAGINL
jgi:hypothetical protein